MKTINRVMLAVLALVPVMGISAKDQLKTMSATSFANNSKAFKDKFSGFESFRARAVESVNRKGKALETAKVEQQKAVNEFETKKGLLKDVRAEEKKLTDLARKVAKLEAEVKAEAEDAERDLRAEYTKLNEELFADLVETIGVWAKEKDVDVVVDSDSGRVLYRRENLDATNEILNFFDKKQEQKVAQAKPAVAPATKVASIPAVPKATT